MSTLFAYGRIPARRPVSYRFSAMQIGGNRVRVLFKDTTAAPTLGLEMDAETYKAVPFRADATPDTFRDIAAERGHRPVVECRPDFDDLYTPSKTYHVTVSFYVEAPSREDAMGFVTEYLDDASRCVIDPRHIVDVDVAGAEEVPDYPEE